MEVNRENLERVVTALAEKIRKHECFKFDSDDYQIILSDELTNSAIIRAGNPVVITLRISDLIDAITKKDSRDFNNLLESSLRTVPRMLHTLALVPIAEVLARNDEIQKWKKATLEEAEKYIPRMLPTNEVYFDIQTVITAYHTRTDTLVRVKGHGKLEALKQEAHAMLSEAIRDLNNSPKLEEKDDSKTTD